MKHRTCSAPALLVILLLFATSTGCSDDEHGAPWLLPEDLADSWMATHEPDEHTWSWGDGVLMYAFAELYREGGDTALLDFIRDWIDHHLATDFAIAFNDHCPPGIALVLLVEETGDPRYRAAIERIERYIFDVARRTSDNGINHMGFITGRQLWVDSLFMVGIFLAEMGRMTGEPAYFDEITEQVRIFSNHLLDPDEDCFYHMWNDRNGNRLPEDPIWWARGNSWAFVTMVELLDRMPAGHPDRAEILAILRAQAAAVAALQDSSGLWYTVMNRPGETYLETSASALFAYGFAKGARTGLLGPEFAETARLATEGVVGKLRRDCADNLILEGTSYGTGPGNFENYAGIKTGPDVDYSVGAVILAAMEMRRTGYRPQAAVPVDCTGEAPEPATADEYVERGKGSLEIGRKRLALLDFERALVLDPSHSSAHFGIVLCDTFTMAALAFDRILAFTVRDIRFRELLDTLEGPALDALEAIIDRMRHVVRDRDFLFELDTLVVRDFGGNNVFGPISLNRGKAMVIQSLFNMLKRLIQTLVRSPG